MDPFGFFGVLLLPIMVAFGVWELGRWATRRDKWLGDAGLWLVATVSLSLDIAAIAAAVLWLGSVAYGWVTWALIGAAIGTVPLWKWANRQDAGPDKR